MPSPKATALYEALGLTADATESEVSRSYRRLALQYHPDRNPDGAETFKELSNAYAVLSDPEKRALYDATGIVSDGQGGAQDESVSTAERSAELEAQVRTFFKNYAGSAEEEEDVIKGFHKCLGDFPKMVREHLLFDNGVDGEVDRLLDLVKDLVSAGRLSSTSTFQTSTSPEKIRKLKKSMAKERREAEEALKEMGLDKSSGGGDAGDLGALQALIQQRQRQSHDALLADMEQRYCASPGTARSKVRQGNKRRMRSRSPEGKSKRRKK